MTRQRSTGTQARRFLGIEAGGTRTVALLVDEASGRRQRHEAGPANLRLLTDAQLAGHFQALARVFPVPDGLGIGLAGARSESDRARILRASARAWPGVPCHATNDLETALMAADWNESVRPRKKTTSSGQTPGFTARVLILSGTGSCCFGRSPDGRTAKIGGWGHVLGDKGSAFEIGLRALKAVVYYYDRDGEWPKLGQRLLANLLLNEPDDLIPWAQQASKTEIAALALEVFQAWSRRDSIAADILTGACQSLVKDALHCAERLAKTGEPVHFVLAGGVLLKQRRFARQIESELRHRRPGSVVTPLQREGAEGAVALARRSVGAQSPSRPLPMAEATLDSAQAAELAHALTEQRNARSARLDEMPTAEAIELMLSEDAKIPRALRAEKKSIEKGVELIARAFRRGGRLFYVGAGTSGRLGVLDASECPPTFRTPPEQVQGIIAGGQSALWQAVEGAEDDPVAGQRAVAFHGIERRDVVVGIAASGRTPFVWGALVEARKRGARTILLTFNPRLTVPRGQRPHLLITPNVGPEILTGSTRLKAGTATKLVLNIFTTLAMVRVGKVAGNLMIDVKATNVKLRDRAARMVQTLSGAGYQEAREALEKAKWDIKKACRRLAKS